MSFDMVRALKKSEQKAEQAEVIERSGNIAGFSSFFDFGTFTPSIIGSTIAGTFTYSVRNGLWTRNGNVVTVSGHVTITAISVAPTGNLQIGGLPFTAATPDPGVLTVSDQTGITFTAGRTQIGARVSASATTALLVQSGSGVQATFIAGGALALISGAAEIVFSGSYRVA